MSEYSIVSTLKFQRREGLMKQMISLILFSLIALCLILCLTENRSVGPVTSITQSDFEEVLSHQQVEELNEYFKALTVTRFMDYEEGSQSSTTLLNFSTQLLQRDYPAMVEPMWREEEAYVSFDKKMLLAVIQNYFNEKVDVRGIYIDLGDYVARPDVRLKTYEIYPQIEQYVYEGDGSYFIQLKLYELDEPYSEGIALTYKWHEEVKCHLIGRASVKLQYDGDDSYLVSYHPIYFE